MRHTPTEQTTWISVDGPTTLVVDGRVVPLSTAERVVLAGMALDRRAGITVEGLIALRWPDDPPRTARQSVQNSVSRLRGRAGLDITLRAGSYHLPSHVVTDEDRLIAAHERLRARPAEARADMQARADIPPLSHDPRWFADLPPTHGVRRAADRLQGLLVHGLAEQAQALRVTGHLAEAVALARDVRLLASDSEAAWIAEVDLLLAAGRRLEAVQTYRQACRTLPQDHGIDPGPDLRAVERRIWANTDAPSVADGHPLVGRQQEVEEIGHLLTTGRTVLVHGPAWSGKSRLAGTVEGRWPVTAVTVDCRRSRRRPLASIATVLGEPLDRLARQAVAPSAPDLLEDLSRRVADALDDVTLLVLDDVDRLAPLSREVFARALRDSGCRVLATTRQPGVAVPGRDDVVPLALAGLGEEEIGALLQVTRTTAQTVRRLTGGRPGLVLLLADAARQAGVELCMLDRLATAEQVPSVIADALLSRIAGLGPHPRVALESLAVAPASRTTLLELTDEALDGVVCLDGDGNPRFCHPLFRRVVVDQVPDGVRAEADLLHAIGRERPAVAMAVSG